MKISKEKLIEISIICILLLVLMFFSTRKVYKLNIGGVFIGYVDSIDSTKLIAKSISKEETDFYNLETIYPINTYEFLKTNKSGKEILNNETLANKIRQFQTYEIDGFVLYINDLAMAYSSSSINLESILSTVKTNFMGEYDSIDNIEFVEPVRIESMRLNLNHLSSKSDLIELTDKLINGIYAKDKYVVKKGDTAIAIAKKYKMSLKNLKNANINSNLNKLKIGQIVNISKPQKIIHIKNK